MGAARWWPLVWLGWAVQVAAAPMLVVHGQNTFQEEAALFFGDPVARWLTTAEGCDVVGGRFEAAGALLAVLEKAQGPVTVYLSTHMVGQGTDSALVIGTDNLSVSRLVEVLERRTESYDLWLDACHTGFVPPRLRHGRVHLTVPGEDAEDDRLGVTPLGQRFLTGLGAPDWGGASGEIAAPACTLPPLPPPGPSHAPPVPAIRQAASALCVARGERLCGYVHWRGLSLDQLARTCGEDHRPEWLADDTGDGRALLWLGCTGGERRFGARQADRVSGEVGFRCCEP